MRPEKKKTNDFHHRSPLFFLGPSRFLQVMKKKDLKNYSFLPPQKKSGVIFLRSKKNLE